MQTRSISDGRSAGATRPTRTGRWGATDSPLGPRFGDRSVRTGRVRRRHGFRWCVCIWCFCILAALGISSETIVSRRSGAVEFAREPTWTIPDPQEIRERALAWLASDAIVGDEASLRRARGPWVGGVPPVDPLDAVMETIARVDPRAAGLKVETPGRADAALAWLDEPSVAAFQRDAVKLWLGRELVRARRFDEASPLLAALDVKTVVDPATLLFNRAACAYWLLDVEAAIESLDLLLERADSIPVRYERLARLMRQDITGLEDESLAHIARRMRDITRRLDLGRAGPATRRVQDGVVTSLDRLIEQIEQQQQSPEGQGGGGGGGGGTGGGSARPMDDSRIAGGRGPGEVQSRALGADDGWGALPPHAREEALQQIGREFPPHYRDVIERYFKRLAAGAEDR